MVTARLFIDGTWVEGAERGTVEHKFTGEPLAELHHASADQVAAAVAALVRGQATAGLGPRERFSVLSRAAELVGARRDELRRTIVDETGFAHRDAEGEINRAIETLRLSGEEAARLTGEMVPLEAAPGVQRRIGYTMRVPVGVVAAITPFNSPLNTVCHKVGPALAAGNAVALKPSAYTPLTAELLVEILLEAGLPTSLIALVHGPGSQAGQALLIDERIGYYTFTGSTEVGRHIRATVGLRGAQLELGSLSSSLVCADADVDTTVAKCANAAFRKAGQVCTSVQRLYVHEDVADAFEAGLTAAAEALTCGDPRDPATEVGPLISEPEAERVERWIERAAERGARVLTGGTREGRVVRPTVLTDVDAAAELMCRELFGPAVVIRRFEDLDEAIAEANDTPYGLAAGVFTRDLHRAFECVGRLHMGSVHINETSSSRIDLMPYGGVKDSGSGKEGPRYAIREMTEERLVTIAY
ncbi:aldehyde dehydrogenase family protein [Egibacter rhizosphaerae]|uniref:Aldehyde dehydrogenase family protein n=1 Tax=Egibacter rhizosphaerae TaxID=1670831 RepID=A0A411YHA1_9ACTN|nr:aldehyde dehydrogenase family protein [Egibacter rhizosphaerae]QBI20489.1 aldehyde dehydrogenase family protein [Egibacter rhizosphaerae]